MFTIAFIVIPYTILIVVYREMKETDKMIKENQQRIEEIRKNANQTIAQHQDR